MFAFTKGQKQRKLANQFYSDYEKLSEQLQQDYKVDLKREAISNAMSDIVDGFTMLRSTYSTDKVRTTQDFRMLRVPGMPGIVRDYYWIANDLRMCYIDTYLKQLDISSMDDVKHYLVKALLKSKEEKIKQEYLRISSKYGISFPFSISRYNTLVCLLSAYTQELTALDTYIIVSPQYNREVCEQFAYNNKIDILISN